MAQQRSNEAPHVAVLASPGMGHLIPLVEFAKRLVLNHHFTVTFIIFSGSSRAESTLLNALPTGLSYTTLPPVELDDIPADALVEAQIIATVQSSAPHIRNVLSELKKTARLAAYVFDLFGSYGINVAEDLNIPRYLFFTTTLMTLSLFFHLPQLHESTTCEYRDLPGPVELPGCVPVPPDHLLHTMQNRSSEDYLMMLCLANNFLQVEGILVNSFVDLEPGAYKALKETEAAHPPVFPVGPLILTQVNDRGSLRRPEAECLNWLDAQPENSVVYVSFGSGGTLSSAQVTELAWGLEECGHRFLWVVRRPSDDEGPDAAYFSHGSGDEDDLLGYLPVGFRDRVEGRGLVVPNWAPQIGVLSHRCIGGFVSHCGWNSTLESIVHGVPMVSWPLYAEQHMNAVMMEDVGAALRPNWRGRNALVTRGDVVEVVKELMEGEKGKRVRAKVSELQAARAAALAGDGTSAKALAEVVGKWRDAL